MPGQRPIYPLSETISPATRDMLIVTLRQRGMALKDIGARVGMSESGVCRALERIRSGRPRGRVRE